MTERRALPRAERYAAGFLAAVVLVQFIPIWARGRTPFWGDMTYIHFPWQAFCAQMFQVGRLPLWNPYLYFGMPAAANMQSAVFYPGDLLFFIFDFASGAALFQVFHYWLAGWLMYLFLRSARLSRGAALGGGVLYCLGGVLISRMPFLNHLSTLSLIPAFLLSACAIKTTNPSSLRSI